LCSERSEERELELALETLDAEEVPDDETELAELTELVELEE
jgi:hypothetical protein